MTISDRAKRMEALVLQALQNETKLTAIATAMGVSTSTISRPLNDHLPKFCEVLVRAGLKIVEQERICVDPDTYRAMTHIATKAMSDPEVARKLVEDES